MTIRERRRTRSWRGEAIAGERSASEVESEAPDSMYQLMVMCSKGDVGVVGGTWDVGERGGCWEPGRREVVPRKQG